MKSALTLGLFLCGSALFGQDPAVFTPYQGELGRTVPQQQPNYQPNNVVWQGQSLPYATNGMGYPGHTPYQIEPERGSTFATVGRYEHHTRVGQGLQRAKDRWDDHFDRLLCCGYAKSHNEMGTPGYRATKTVYWGGSCEFFVEPCRTPPVVERTSRWNRMMNEMFGSTNGCNSCR